MTQDTRKDRRVKIVSLNVRYKSATVDEFIENHAHDVSRGGIYIKTGSPFPPGTLLKFEIRLASDQAVITGVGRVVWKRDTAQGTSDRPAGMGVKFIKIDEPSKTVIDRLVNSRSDAGRSYESESETGHAESTPAPAAAAARPASNRPAANRVGKSTMLGIGAAGGTSAVHSVPRPAGSVPPRPSGSGGMFPRAVPEEDAAPKQEQTVMKQAAELLEEALREAGGSMEDVGTNPLFAGTAAPSNKVELKPASAPPPSESAETAAEAARARAMVAGMAPGQPKKALTDPPRTSRESPVAKVPDRVEPRPSSVRPRPAIASVPPRPPKKGSGGTLVILVVAAAAAVVGVVYRGAIFGEPEAAPTPSAAQAAIPPPSASAAGTAPAASEAPVASAEPGASASAAAAASASASPLASAAPSASAASATATATATAPAVVRRPKPVAPSVAAAATAAATARDDSASAAPTSEPAASAAPKATATSAPTAAAAPKKPAKPVDDNPY
jgi:uncharacterized protein (TIGR02266 family)